MFPGKAATGSSIKLGLIVSEGGPTISQPEARETVEAAIEYANENLGGIAGHKIELVTCKNKEDSASGLACANQMVQAGVVGVITPSTSTGSVMVPIIAKAGIAYMVPTAASPGEYTTPNSFNLSSGLPGYYYAAANYAAKEGLKSLTMYLVDAGTYVATTKAIAQPLFDKAGVKLNVVAIPLGTPDATAQVTAGLRDNPGAAYILGDEHTCLVALKGLDAVGSSVQRWMGINCMKPDVQKAVGPNAYKDGVTILTNVDPATATDDDSHLFRAIMQKYAPTAPTNGTAASAFQVALGFLRATEGVGDSVMAATVLNAIKTATNVPLPLGDGLTFTCNGMAYPSLPAICSSGALVGHITDGKITSYDVVR